MNAKGRVKGDGAFKFYVSKSLLEEVWAITHDARRTMHNGLPKTHDPRPTTHPPTPISQSRLPSIISNVINIKNQLWKAVKFSKTKISIPFNRLQVCPSLAPFVFAVLLSCICSFCLCCFERYLVINFSGDFRDSCPLNGSCLRHMFLQPPGEGISQNVLAL